MTKQRLFYGDDNNPLCVLQRHSSILERREQSIVRPAVDTTAFFSSAVKYEVKPNLLPLSQEELQWATTWMAPARVLLGSTALTGQPTVLSAAPPLLVFPPALRSPFVLC